MSEKNYQRFADLSFDDFRRMASDQSLSCYEKIGFPDSYRENKEHLIFRDIDSKLHLSTSEKLNVLDIGPGCSTLPAMLIDTCKQQGHELLLVDSEEMLGNLPNAPYIQKFPGYYPECPELFDSYAGKVDLILCYSVFHYVFVDSNMWTFLDKSLELLNEGGRFLIGDIPNASMRRRFFKSNNGKKFHQEFTGDESKPDVIFNEIENKSINDSIVLSIVLRCREAGFNAYIVPQSEDLPMSNRREDILITRP